jgi:hypothetical protein
MNFFLLDAPIFIARYSAGPGYLLIDQLFAQASQGRLCCSIRCVPDPDRQAPAR